MLPIISWPVLIVLLLTIHCHFQCVFLPVFVSIILQSLTMWYQLIILLPYHIISYQVSFPSPHIYEKLHPFGPNVFLTQRCLCISLSVCSAPAELRSWQIPPPPVPFLLVSMLPSRIVALWLPSWAQTRRGPSIWAAAGQSGGLLEGREASTATPAG